MSNVEAVKAAQVAKKATEQKAAKEITEYKAFADNRIADAINAKIRQSDRQRIRYKISKRIIR